MEELLFRFSLLGEVIFDSLNDQSLSKCKKVSKTWSSFMEDKKFFWNRPIIRHDKKFNSKHIDCLARWKKLFQKTRLEDVREFAKECHLEMDKTFSISEFVAPFASACVSGNISIGKSNT